jgi:hypothetical protein
MHTMKYITINKVKRCLSCFTRQTRLLWLCSLWWASVLMSIPYFGIWWARSSMHICMSISYFFISWARSYMHICIERTRHAHARPQRKYIQRVHSSQNKSHARLAILRMRNLPASTVKFFYKEIDGEIRIFVVKTAILTKLSGWFAVSF